MPKRRAFRVALELTLTLALAAGAVTLAFAADPPSDPPPVAVPRSTDGEPG